jgi:hypothetical protein
LPLSYAALGHYPCPGITEDQARACTAHFLQLPGRKDSIVLLASRKDAGHEEQRQLPALRAYIEQLLGQGWVIAARNPLKLQFGQKTCQVRHGMLISESTL